MDVGTFLGKLVTLQEGLDAVAQKRRDLEIMAKRNETFSELLTVWKKEVLNSLQIDLVTREAPEVEQEIDDSEQTPPEEKGVNP